MTWRLNIHRKDDMVVFRRLSTQTMTDFVTFLRSGEDRNILAWDIVREELTADQ